MSSSLAALSRGGTVPKAKLTLLSLCRVANNAVREINGDPCSIAPFGVAVVNTTSNELVCVAANRVGLTGSEFRCALLPPKCSELALGAFEAN